MAKTGAERHAEWRARHKARLADLMAENESLKADAAKLRREVAMLREMLDATGPAEPAAVPCECRAEWYDAETGTCGSCGKDKTS